MDFDREHDERVRAAAFGWLASQVSSDDGVVSRDVLTNGFEYVGSRLRFVGPPGDFQAIDHAAAAFDHDVAEQSVRR